VNFSRTCWITFHWRGIDSSASVMVSPSFRSLLPPQHWQVVGPGTTTRSRGSCSGNGLRAGRLRVNAATFVVFAAAFSAAISSSVAELSRQLFHRPQRPLQAGDRTSAHPGQSDRSAAQEASAAGLNRGLSYSPAGIDLGIGLGRNGRRTEEAIETAASLAFAPCWENSQWSR
jgi:hypothetical protein